MRVEAQWLIRPTLPVRKNQHGSILKSSHLFCPWPQQQSDPSLRLLGAMQCILGHFFIALNPVLDKGLFFGTRGSAPSCHTWTERSLFYHFFFKVSFFAVPAPRVRHNNTALRQDEPTLAFSSVRLSAASWLRLQFFFLSPWGKKKRWLSRLPVSQRQAGLGVPSRSDRSLITATVSQEQEREGEGSAGVGGGKERGGEGRCRKRRLIHAGGWGGEHRKFSHCVYDRGLPAARALGLKEQFNGAVRSGGGLTHTDTGFSCMHKCHVSLA